MPANRKRMTDRQKLQELKQFIRLCFGIIEESEDDPKEIANLTGLSVSTVIRIGKGKLSLKTHYNTVRVMANAAGLKLDWSDMTVSLQKAAA